VKEAFVECPHWRQSEKELRELRKMMTFAICVVESDFYKVTPIVDNIIKLLEKAYKI